MDITGKHSFKAVHSEQLGLSVYNCGFHKCEPLYSWGPAIKNHYIIHIVAEGNGTFNCKDKKYFLSAGDGFLCPVGQLISYTADKSTPWEYYWVGFSGPDAERLIADIGLSEDNPCFHSVNSEKLIECIMKIYEANGNRLFNEIEMVSHLYGFFSELIKENQTKTFVSHVSTDYVSVALKFIKYNFSNDISINDIAESAGISRSHLYRLFVEQLKVTPNEYLIKYRLDNACKLLKSGGVNISEAAYSSGFSDPLYFSRVFKKHKGITPSQFAKEK